MVPNEFMSNAEISNLLALEYFHGKENMKTSRKQEKELLEA